MDHWHLHLIPNLSHSIKLIELQEDMKVRNRAYKGLVLSTFLLIPGEVHYIVLYMQNIYIFYHVKK